MKNAESKKSEFKMVAAIVKNLEAARSEGRFEDALFHLGEIVAVHMHTENDLLKLRCAHLLGAAPAPQEA